MFVTFDISTRVVDMIISYFMGVFVKLSTLLTRIIVIINLLERNDKNEIYYKKKYIT